jgi:hypothetical protein
METKGSPSVRYARRRRSEKSEANEVNATVADEGSTAGPNMKMKLKVKPRAEPEKKKGDEVVSKVGAKLNNAFERLVATLGYDATQDDYDVMDEEEEPQIVEAKQQKEKHGLADEATSGGLAAGLQTLAKQLHAFGHNDVVPFTAGESDAFDDVDDFDLCEEVVSSEEPAGDQPATDAAVAAEPPAQKGTTIRNPRATQISKPNL